MELNKYKLGDIGEIRMCKRILKSQTSTRGDIPFYKIGTFGKEADTFINKDLFDTYKNLYSFPNKGDILISAAGTIGRCVVYNGEDSYYQDSNIVWIENDESSILNDYLFYVLDNITWNPSKGSTILRLYNDDIREKDFYAPDLMCQRVIADTLKTIDKKIELNRQINDNLEAMAKQLYDYWFVQFDFPNEEGKPYKSSGGAMVWNEKLKREIPQGWSDCKLKDFINLFDLKRVPLSSKDRGERQGVYPYYGATGIMDYVNDYIFDGDYILLAEDGSTSDAKGFPIVQYIWGKNWVNNHAHIILPKNERYMMFIYQMLRSIPAKQIETGSIQKKISQENLCGYKMVLPNSDLLEKYENVVSPLWEKRKRCIEEINILTKQRDELLPLLMNGQASVNYHLSASFLSLYYIDYIETNTNYKV